MKTIDLKKYVPKHLNYKLKILSIDMFIHEYVGKKQ